ncbi:hypothetical protein ACWD4P_12740 [Kitasatospora sp. NPDC002543]
MPTIREQLLTALCDPTEHDADVLGLPEDQAAELLDSYRAEVLAEAAEIASTVIGPRWHLDTVAEVQVRLNSAAGGAR